MKILFSNNARATLASSIGPSDTSLSVSSGLGAAFPTIDAASGDYFKITLTNSAATLVEICKVTAHTSGSDSFTTIVRAQEGTTALSWNAGDLVVHRWTAETAEDLITQNVKPQCLLTSGGAGSLTLVPWAGFYIPLYTSGRWRIRRLPVAGVSLSTGSLALNTSRYVYAYWTGTAIAIELSATAYTYDEVGLPTKTGDLTRLLVGAVIGNDSAQIDISGRMWGVSSYYNRQKRSVLLISSGTQTLTADATFRILPGVLAPVTVWNWNEGDAIDMNVTVSGSGGAASSLIASAGVSATTPVVPKYMESSGTVVASMFSHRFTGTPVGITTIVPLYYASPNNLSMVDGRGSCEVWFTA